MTNSNKGVFSLGQFTILLLLASLLWPSATDAARYIAYSMKQAEAYVRQDAKELYTVPELGGITKLAGIVYDLKSNDLIIVGQANTGEQAITVDDFVVAIRAILKHGTAPLVSIDTVEDTHATHRQSVRFGGGGENTQFGLDLLKADVVLKKLALGKLPTRIWGFQSYFELIAERMKRGEPVSDVGQLFWFYIPEANALALRSDVVAIRDVRVAVTTKITGTTDKFSIANNKSQVELGTEFANILTNHYKDLRVAYPDIARLKVLFDLVALATGIGEMQDKPMLAYWINEYKVMRVETPTNFPVVETERQLNTKEGKQVLRMDGGIELKALILKLQDGDITALRDAVIFSKPTPDSLMWEVPLVNWNIPGSISRPYHSLEELDSSSAYLAMKDRIGMPIYTRVFSKFGQAQSGGSDYHSMVKSSPWNYSKNIEVPRTFLSRSGLFRNQLPKQSFGKPGGIILENVADVKSDDRSPLDMAGAKFSFVVDGKDSQLDPLTFRKFITALWTIYYSNEDPGISIDPIAPGAEKHLVRYIGRVINTDLGRIMREADYLMKKWAVGTEDPGIRGFKSPLDYAADAGMLSVGAWSRFWFVPKDMQFRRSENMLLFNDGKMTVQTEYMFQGFGTGADPSNQKFAEFFTNNYQTIAKKYPVFNDLYEYAKMVSLAKYLKDSGVPLFWFLMANKDLVITEDSISTVDALVKSSTRFEGVQIEGGVDLYSEGQYIYDDEALSAINNAWVEHSGSYGTTSLGTDKISSRAISDPFSFRLNERSLTVLPQHSPSSGKDYRGIRYQTDFTIKEAGYQLTAKSMAELKRQIFRYKYAELLYNAAEKEPIGNIEIIQNESWQKAELHSANLTKNLKDIINNDFKSKARFHKAIEKYLPKDVFQNWKEMISKYAFYNTSLELVRCFHSGVNQNGTFGLGWDLLIPYQLKPFGNERVEFRGLIMPKQIAFVDKLSGKEEILTFNDRRFRAAAYIPKDVKSSHVVGLFFMTDGTYRLLDKIENEFVFNPAGYLTEMIFSDIHQIKFEYQKDFEIMSDEPTYAVERASKKWVKFRGVHLPEKIRIKDLTGGSSEIFVFSKNKAIIGYAPENHDRSQFKFLALMSDLSYRLLDKNDNEIVFDTSGKFEKMISTSEELSVKSMSSGNYRIGFIYKLNKGNRPVIAEAELIKDGKDDSRLVMQYFYDNGGRLSRAAIKGDNNIAKK